jgi:hypothetical protein
MVCTNNKARTMPKKKNPAGKQKNNRDIEEKKNNLKEMRLKKQGNRSPGPSPTGLSDLKNPFGAPSEKIRPLSCPNMTLFLIMAEKPYHIDTKKPGPRDRAFQREPYSSIIARISCILRIR